MRQSTAVVLTMMAAFLVFVTVRGELPAYLNVLFGPVPAAGATSTSAVPNIGTGLLGLPSGSTGATGLGFGSFLPVPGL